MPYHTLLLVVIALYLAACASAPPPDTPRITVHPVNPWTHLNLNNDPDHFQFAIVSDRTGGARPGVFEDAVRKLNLLQPEFVMSVGDLIEGYTEDRARLEAEWREFDGFVKRLDMPFFYLPGNHDITNQVMADLWKKRYGPAYYHFVYRDVLFLCLNSEGPPANRIDEDQIAYAADALAANPDVRWTLVFVHKPLWNYRNETHWDRVEALLKDRPHSVFAGHFHTYTKHRRQDQNYFVLATTGGGSGLRGPLYGQFDHVVWVTMTDAGPRIANLLLEGIWDEDVRTEQSAAMVNALARGRAIAIDPIYTGAETFRSGATRLRLTNDADVPLHVRGRFAPHTGLEATPAHIDLTVPPNEVRLIDVQLTAAKMLPTSAVRPLKLEWNAAYQRPESVPITLEGTASLGVERQRHLPRRETPVTVDGRLDDWPDLPYVVTQPHQIRGVPDTWQGPSDASFRFGIAYDETHLYIGVEVTDERAVRKPGANPWHQDGIEVRLDARPDPARSANRGGGEFRDYLAVLLAPASTPDKMVFIRRKDMPAGLTALCVPTAIGHNTEIAVPLAYVKEKQGADWKAVRLNIAVDDYDEPQGDLAQLWWRPAWNSAETYPGSGTFNR